MNKFDMMREAMQEAQSVQWAADAHATQMASMLAGRLRKVSPWALKKLKRELSEFNATTRQWNT